MQNFYLITKIVHIVAVTSWMAGLFYLPRLFVYHCDAKIHSDMDNTFKIMETKLFNYIMIPAMIFTWITGIILAQVLNLHNLPFWYVVKVIMVLVMTLYNFILYYHLIKFANNTNTKSHKYFRFMNEIPTLLLIVIVVMVVMKFQ